MNILITGANGYLAKNLIKELINKTKHNLTLLVRKDSNVDELLNYINIENVVFYDDKIESLKDLKKNKIDLVFHLANYYPDANRPDISEVIISSNLTLIENVVSSLERDSNSGEDVKKFRIINITSHVIWDEGIDSLYKHTKYSALCYLKSKNCKNYVLYDTYGKNDSRPKLINYLISYSKTGEKLNMNRSMNWKINLVYLKDVISAFMLAIENEEEADILDISNNFLTLKQVVDTFNEVSKNKVNVVWPKDHSSNSFTQTHNTPNGWKPKYNLTMGLTEILKP